ncbi:MAG: hypothetical protein ACR2IK_18190, partial [Chloroflexota bacterium]
MGHKCGIGGGLNAAAAALALILALAVSMGAPGSARATYPGANGTIAVESSSSSYCGPSEDTL